MSFMILVMINFWIIIPICMQVINQTTISLSYLQTCSMPLDPVPGNCFYLTREDQCVFLLKNEWEKKSCKNTISLTNQIHSCTSPSAGAHSNQIIFSGNYTKIPHKVYLVTASLPKHCKNSNSFQSSFICSLRPGKTGMSLAYFSIWVKRWLI